MQNVTILVVSYVLTLLALAVLKAKMAQIIDFMALTMFHPASSWFKFVELPLVCQPKTIAVNVKESSIVEEILDKNSNCTA
jgi:hypothetical protein